MGNMKYNRKIVCRIRVDLGQDIENYAKSFLAIYNNVKNDKDLLKMYNDYGNNVYVVCEEHVRDAAVQFLEQFGEVKSVDKVEAIQPICLDFDYGNDYDVEFLSVEEI
jgi:hypothetical protein